MMDTSCDVAVSLDELTFDFCEDGSMKQQEILFGDVNKPDNYVAENDFYSQGHKISDVIDLDKDRCFIAKEFVQIDNDDIPVPHTLNLKTNACQEREAVIQNPDMEADIALLSFIKYSKINTTDDSDFEFEVPDEPMSSPLIETRAEPAKGNVEIPLCKPSEHSSQFQPEILTSPDDISVDFSQCLQNLNTSPIPTAQKALLHNQSNHPNFLKENGTTETPDNKSGEYIKEDWKSSQDCFPKCDPFINITSDVQHQLSDGVIKQHQMTLTVASCIEDGRNDGEAHQMPKIVTTAEDWDEIQTVEPGFLKSGDKVAGQVPVIESKPLASFLNTWVHFENADYSSVKNQIKTQIERHGFSALRHMLFGPPKLRRNLLPQRELLFCIAATQFNNDNETHIRVLQTIYRCLTGSKFDCQRFGNHWEEIGFQGRDPATDLRGTGMLALLHLLYFLESSNTRELARDVYKLSLHPTQNFPFCLMGINLSRICLQVLREDVFNKECNNCREVTSTMNNVYAALFLRLYREWKKGKTIADSGFVLQELETYCRKHSQGVVKDLESYEKTRKLQGMSRKDSDVEPSFYNVCKDD